MRIRALRYDREKPLTRYHLLLIAVFLAVWIWAAIHPVDPGIWFLENLLVFVFVPLIIAAGQYFRFSLVSYSLIAIFMCLHVVGSHYTYAEVPFGFLLQDLFHASRNMYDRMVHFSFGLLLAYPVREVFLRLAKVKGFWGYSLPLDMTLSLSAIYEMVEWLVAIIVDPGAGTAFLGTQGDEWDAVKDMASAGAGAFIALTAVMLFNAHMDKNFWREWRASFRLRKKDHPLGELELKRLLDGQE